MFQSPVIIGENRTFERLVAGLSTEFGTAAAEGLARHFIEAEDADFYWDARTAQRWLGTYESLEDEEELLARLAVSGRFDGRYFVAVMIVDGDEKLQAMLGLRLFESAAEAREAYGMAH